MSKISDHNLWNRLVAYCLNKMSSTEELEMDSYLEKNPKAAELADSLLDYCSANNISEPAELVDAIDKDHQFYNKFPRNNSRKNTFSLSKRNRWLIAAAILLLLGAFFWQRPSSPAYAPEIAQFWQQEAPRIRAASSADQFAPWEEAFLNNDYNTAIDRLEVEINQLPAGESNQQLFYLTVLYAWQRPAQTKRIQQLLPRLEGTIYEEDIKKELEKAGVKFTNE